MNGQDEREKELERDTNNAEKDATDMSGDEQKQNGTESPERTIETVEKEYGEKIKQLEDRYLRLAAEFDNYKKRTSRQFEEVIRNANENLIVQFLEVVDNFHRALEAVPAGKKSEEFEAFLRGMELTYQHFSELLKKAGVERIKAVGEKFDPSWHDAMMQIDSDEYPDGTVAQELAAGYQLNGKVIRHTRVAVSRGKSGTAEEEPPSEAE
ncbi:Protein GrpE [Candidatus Zixiibacteriota bacterium]|nr:Protein GrpE [candidate division Zixibacteria bacterium]